MWTFNSDGSERFSLIPKPTDVYSKWAQWLEVERHPSLLERCLGQCCPQLQVLTLRLRGQASVWSQLRCNPYRHCFLLKHPLTFDLLGKEKRDRHDKKLIQQCIVCWIQCLPNTLSKMCFDFFPLAGDAFIQKTLRKIYCKVRGGRCALFSCLTTEEQIGQCSKKGRKCCRKKKQKIQIQDESVAVWGESSWRCKRVK